MTKRTISPEDLKRLYAERKAADRAYNDALTALADALQQLHDLPDPPPPYDDRQVAALHALSDPLAEAPADGAGWRGRLRARVQRMVAPMFERQKAFNAALVDHIDRNAATHREVPRAVAASMELIRGELERLVHFQHRLVQFAAEITPYVDTKDREASGLTRRINEDNAEFAADLATRVLPRLDRLSDEIDTWQHVIAALKRDMAALPTPVALRCRPRRRWRTGSARSPGRAARTGPAAGRRRPELPLRGVREPVPRFDGRDPRPRCRLPVAVRGCERRAGRRLRPRRIPRPAP